MKLSDAIEEIQFNSLLNSCSLADKARLLSVPSPHASVWISVGPQLGTAQTAVKWWLGVNPSLSLDGNPMVCPLCLNCTLDPLGYHCVTCKRGGDITTRHDTLRNVTSQRAGLSAYLEVGCGWGQNNSRTRPADILVTNWDCGTQLPLTFLLHPRLIQLICWKQACTRVFQQRHQSTENIQKMSPSVLSWASNVY